MLPSSALWLSAVLVTTVAPVLPGDVVRAAPAAQRSVVREYLTALQQTKYAAAYALLDRSGRAYYRSVRNFRSVFAADAYRIERFSFVAERTGGVAGKVFFMRESARYRDHAHDIDLRVTATVPVGVVREGDGWRIKDPGHPWRAFATHAVAEANGVSVRVKKLSFFARRIEAIVTFANTSAAFVTLLPYGKSLLRDRAGHPYRIIETRDWSLTDKALFEGVRLAPNARYTGVLAFASPALDDTPQAFELTLAPLLAAGGDAPFSIDVSGIVATADAGPDAEEPHGK